jgi:hypothetical protein
MLNVSLAAPQRHHALTVFPLITTDPAELPYTLLVDALQAGTLKITEIGSGTVPELLATNKSDADILVLDGEQLIGARQNRMTNRSILLPAASETKIPVSCMEQGRWRFVGYEFAPSKQHSPSAVRRKARESEAEYAAMDMAAPPEALSHAQYGVWDSITEHARKVGARSNTGALDHLYEARADDVELWTRHFPAMEGQVGVLAFLGVRPLGMDVIGGRTLYRKLHERLIRGYIMDALGSRSTREPGPERAQDFLDRVRVARRVESPTVGQGRYYVLAGVVIGGELKGGEGVVHLSAFPGREPAGGQEDEHAERPRYPIAPPSQRRRSRSPAR